MQANRLGRSTWSDVMIALGVLFLFTAFAVFFLLALQPTGAVNTSAWNPWLMPAGGIIGIALLAFGIYHRRTERR